MKGKGARYSGDGWNFSARKRQRKRQRQTQGEGEGGGEEEGEKGGGELICVRCSRRQGPDFVTRRRGLM